MQLCCVSCGLSLSCQGGNFYGTHVALPTDGLVWYLLVQVPGSSVSTLLPSPT
jgi:hypothetical protein